MAGIVKKFLDMWNNEEEYEDESDDQQEEENSIITRRQTTKNEHSKILNIHRGKTQISCFKPDAYDGQIAEVANSLLTGSVVILDLELENTSPNIACRIIDFLRGSVHAVQGKFVKVSRNTYVLTPSTVEVNGADLINELASHDIYI